MKKTFTLIGTAWLALSLYSCQAKNDEAASSSAVLKESGISANENSPGRKAETDYLTSRAATSGPDDSLHLFVRKASLSFRTNDILKATVGIEDIVNARDGYIEKSELVNEVLSSETVIITADRELVISKVQPEAQLNVRIPVMQLDAFLRDLHPYVTVMYTRRVDASNIAFEAILSRLQRSRIEKHAAAGRNQKDAAAADKVLERGLQSDEMLVNELKLGEQVQYASVSLRIKGGQQIVKEPLVVLDGSGYEPGFFQKLGSSLVKGWSWLVAFVLFLAEIWPLLLAGAAVLLVIRMRKGRARNKAAAVRVKDI
jgi:hypothetical protein